jgi:hypothetical protein
MKRTALPLRDAFMVRQAHHEGSFWRSALLCTLAAPTVTDCPLGERDN